MAMSMQRNLGPISLFFTGVLVLSLSGCKRQGAGEANSWPPVSGQLHERFRAHRDGLEQLSEELVGSDYESVVLLGDGTIKASRYSSDGYESFKLEEPTVWEVLFERAGVDTARKYDAIMLHNRFELAGDIDGTAYDYWFVKSGEYELPNCVQSLSDSECGLCTEEIDDSWHLRLAWYPSRLLTAYDSYFESQNETPDELMRETLSNLGPCLDQFFDEYVPLKTDRK